MFHEIQDWLQAHFIGSMVVATCALIGCLVAPLLLRRRAARRRYRERERQRVSFWGWG